MSIVLRTAVMRIMSEMLDDPDGYGIYPTGRFMDRIEKLLETMMAAPESMQLSGSEALYGFAAWLTCREETVIAGLRHDAAVWAALVDEFCNTNHLTEPREMWDELLTHPVNKKAAQTPTGRPSEAKQNQTIGLETNG